MIRNLFPIKKNRVIKKDDKASKESNVRTISIPISAPIESTKRIELNTPKPTKRQSILLNTPITPQSDANNNNTASWSTTSPTKHKSINSYSIIQPYTKEQFQIQEKGIENIDPIISPLKFKVPSNQVTPIRKR